MGDQAAEGCGRRRVHPEIRSDLLTAKALCRPVALVLPCGMATVGLRELRQNASELVRRVEEGEEIIITVAGRSGARLVAAVPHAWRSWNDVAELFAGPAELDWSADQDRIAHDVGDPWAQCP